MVPAMATAVVCGDDLGETLVHRYDLSGDWRSIKIFCRVASETCQLGAIEVQESIRVARDVEAA
jgi:hypothetical protein